MSSVTQITAKDQFDKIKQFVNELQAQPKVKETIDTWGFSIQHKPIEVDAQVADAGKILMGGGK